MYTIEIYLKTLMQLLCNVDLANPVWYRDSNIVT